MADNLSVTLGTEATVAADLIGSVFGNRGASDYLLNDYFNRAVPWSTEVTNGQMIQVST